MSILDPMACGFAKVAVYNIISVTPKKLPNERETDFLSRIRSSQFRSYMDYFGEYRGNFEVTYKQFLDNFQKIVPNINNFKKRHSKGLKIILETFSNDTWENLITKKKSEHSLESCSGCMNNKKLKTALSSLPSKSNKLTSKATKAGLYKDKILKDVTNKVVGELNTTYQKEFRVDFVTQAKKYVPEFAAVKAGLKKLAKDVVNDIENQYHETSLKR